MEDQEDVMCININKKKKIPKNSHIFLSIIGPFFHSISVILESKRSGKKGGRGGEEKGRETREERVNFKKEKRNEQINKKKSRKHTSIDH